MASACCEGQEVETRCRTTREPFSLTQPQTAQRKSKKQSQSVPSAAGTSLLHQSTEQAASLLLTGCGDAGLEPGTICMPRLCPTVDFELFPSPGVRLTKAFTSCPLTSLPAGTSPDYLIQAWKGGL